VQYEPAGGGGTDFMANWEYMRRNDIQPKKLIMFTDGYPFGAWGEPEFCDTVFIIHGNDKIEPPFGTWAYYDPKEGVTVQ
jgi:predicted metal-dependent peptidase